MRHRIAGWNGKNRQWDYMRSVPFSPGEGGSRLPAGCDETTVVIGEDCFFIAKVYSWTSARIDWEAGTIANHLGYQSPIEIERTALLAWAKKAIDALPDIKPSPAALEDQTEVEDAGSSVAKMIETFLQPPAAAPTPMKRAVLPGPEITANLRDGSSVPKRAPGEVRDRFALHWMQHWVSKFIELNGRPPLLGKEVVGVMQEKGFQERVIRRAYHKLPGDQKQPACNPGHRYGLLAAER